MAADKLFKNSRDGNLLVTRKNRSRFSRPYLLKDSFHFFKYGILLFEGGPSSSSHSQSTSKGCFRLSSGGVYFTCQKVNLPSIRSATTSSRLSGATLRSSQSN